MITSATMIKTRSSMTPSPGDDGGAARAPEHADRPIRTFRRTRRSSYPVRHRKGSFYRTNRSTLGRFFLVTGPTARGGNGAQFASGGEAARRAAQKTSQAVLSGLSGAHLKSWPQSSDLHT